MRAYTAQKSPKIILKEQVGSRGAWGRGARGLGGGGGGEGGQGQWLANLLAVVLVGFKKMGFQSFTFKCSGWHSPLVHF